MANGLLSKQKPDAFAGLLSSDPDPSISYRSDWLPYLSRTIHDPIDDVSEYEQSEWGSLPSLLYDPLKFLVGMGQTIQGERPIDPDAITKGMLDVGMLSAAGGLFGGVPKGGVLGANVGGNISEGIRKAYADEGRMLASEAPLGAKGQELGVPVPYSKTLKIPKSELDVLEQGLVRKEAPNMGKRKIIDLADIEGEKLFPLVGDRTSREIISTVGGQKLNKPITTEGGFGYTMADDTGGWASHANVIKRIKNAIDKEGGGIGVAMPMAGTGSDYSMHSIDVLYGLNLPKKMTNQAQQIIKKLVNERIATKNTSLSDNKKMPEFKGLNNPDSYNYFLKNPTARKFLMESLDKKEVRSIPSMPDAIMLRQAVTDASLKNMKRGDIDALAGQSLVRFNPNAETRLSSSLPSPHKTYNTDLEGEYLGGLLQAVPRSLLMPDYVNKKLSEGYPQFRIDYLMPRESKLPFQQITPKVVDTVSSYIENLIRKGGK